MDAIALPTVDTFVNNVWCYDAETLLRSLPENSVHCIVTSPPYYGLRDYKTAEWVGGDPTCEHKTRPASSTPATSTLGGGKRNVNHAHEGYRDVCPRCGAVRVDEQIGLERTPEQYIDRLVGIFRLARRVLREDGVMWVNMGDGYANSPRGNRPDDFSTSTLNGIHTSASYRERLKNGTNQTRDKSHLSGFKPKDLLGMPWRLALALQADGWWLRSDIIWHKPNPMPESVTDRCSVAHEYVFMLTKSAHYYYDADAIRTPLKPKTFTTHGCDHHPQKGDDLVRSKNWSDSVTKRKPKLLADGSIAGANKRTVWTVASEPSPIPHFAMFPKKLIEPMILAGCPEQVCSVCGAGYVRVVESESMKIRRTEWGTRAGNRTATSGTMLEPARRQTIGFRPSCDCQASTRPGIVLDPFIGVGTTALVAQKHNRDYIGCDLNPETVELARLRILYRGDDKRLMKERAVGVMQIPLSA